MVIFFFFNDTATTEIYTLSLHDALPISQMRQEKETLRGKKSFWKPRDPLGVRKNGTDRKSTRLNSSHLVISYAVFCLKKKSSERCLQPCRINIGNNSNR